MTTAGPHFGDELQELLDKRLNANVRRDVEIHVETCADCRRELDALAWVKHVVRLIPAVRAPEELRREVLSAIRTEKIEVERISRKHVVLSQKLPFVLAFAVLAGLAVILAREFRAQPVAIPEAAVRDFHGIRDKRVALNLQTDNPEVLGAYFSGFDVPFPVRIIKPDENGFRLVGGGILEPGAHARALVAYRGPTGETLIAQASNGTTDELPAGASVHERGGVRLHAYNSRGITSVFWQDGPVLRALISEIPQEEVVRIAESQALR